MHLIKISEEENGIADVLAECFDISVLPEREVDNWIQVEKIPTPEIKKGKTPVLRYSVAKKEIFYQYVSRQLTAEEELQNIKEQVSVFMSPTDKYDSLDKSNTPLDKIKDFKMDVLKEQCSQAIYDGFTSGKNEFGFNETDQANFTQRMLTIVAGAEGPFKWKSKNNGVVELSKDEFIQTIQDAEAHKLVQQEKYWGLEKEVLTATTNEEVDAVTW